MLVLVAALTSCTSAASQAETRRAAAGAITTGRYVPVVPTRVADTRRAFGTSPAGRLRANVAVTLAVTGRREVQVPSSVTAVVLGVVSVGASAPSYVTVWPAGAPRPNASNLNVVSPGQAVADLVTSRLSTSGQLSLLSSAPADLVVDLYGYYEPASGAVTAGRTVAITPTRAYDSRSTGGALGAGQTRVIPLPASAVPAGSSAAVLNLTVTQTRAPGFWTIFPTASRGGPVPTTSNLNVAGPGRTVAVQAIVPVGADRTVKVFSSGGGHAIVDVFAYITGATTPASTAGLFVPLAAPVRFADTRTASNDPLANHPQALYPGWTMEVPTLGRLGVPAAASLVAATTTYVGARSPGYLSVLAAGTPRPATSAVNADAAGETVANHTTIPVGTRGVAVYASGGGNVIVDIAGYFTGSPQPSTLPPPKNVVPLGRTSCRAVVHIGDSTSVGLISASLLPNPADRIGAQYARVGVVEQHLEISGARSIVETLPGQINAYDTAVNLRNAGYHGCWVLALGTTDTANVAVGSPVSRATRIARMMSVIGNEPVLWVNVRTIVTSGAWSEPNMLLWNQALAQALPSYPNLKIYDWASVVQTSWFSSDRVHYTSEGYRNRARMIADGLATAFPA